MATAAAEPGSYGARGNTGGARASQRRDQPHVAGIPEASAAQVPERAHAGIQIRRHLTGNLLLDVALNTDGSINEISVRRSSGQKILDDAAVRIVELSAPFAPFPPEIRADLDVLHITRTWKFNESGLSSEN